MIIQDNFCQFCIKNVCCDLSSEPSHRDGSDEGPQHIVSMKISKFIPQLSSNTPSYLKLSSSELNSFLLEQTSIEKRRKV